MVNELSIYFNVILTFKNAMNDSHCYPFAKTAGKLTKINLNYDKNFLDKSFICYFLGLLARLCQVSLAVE